MEELFNNTILIVDDTPENIDILVELLEDFDKQIAINGEDALETAWEDETPDLILLDIMMPEMDGYEVCERLRADERTKDVPVIFLTAKTLKEDIIRGFEVGGQDYITKPFDARELMERVKTQLELKSQREILKNMNTVLEEKVKERTAQLDQANKELKSLDTAKNTFLTMISHEIRTPLNGIVGASYFLNTELAEDSELGEFVEMLQLSVDRLEYFSSTALLITQLQTNYEVSPEEINVKEMVEACVEEQKEKAAKKELKLFNKIVNKGLILNAEREHIERALNAIIDNAIKYSDQAGEIILDATETDGHLQISCKDKGRGFTQEALDNLFKLFGLGEAHYDKNVGLSLKAAKLIMKAHGGDIKVKNNAGSGALVSLNF